MSLSGGRTSGRMAWLVKVHLSDKFDIVYTFANTSQEREETLEFVDRMDREWSLGVVWLEAVIDPRKGSPAGHRVVTFETAARNGEVFETMIAKYGIPNKAYPHCTRELKLRPMRSYMKAIGWEKHMVAIGIREDEQRRVRADADAERIVYPLVDWYTEDKQDVNDWWATQPFNLPLQEHQGNCSWCWKKSLKKHMRLIEESPEIYDFPRRMEAAYGTAGSNRDGTPRVFFRNGLSTDDMFAMADMIDLNILPASIDMDADSGCSESCEVDFVGGNE